MLTDLPPYDKLALKQLWHESPKIQFITVVLVGQCPTDVNSMYYEKLLWAQAQYR